MADFWGANGGFGVGSMMLMMGGRLLFWAAVILGVVWLLRGAFDGSTRRRNESPTEVLERRFAEGAMPVEEYRQRREALGHGRPRTDHAGGEATGG